jgi:hypothetical protein
MSTEKTPISAAGSSFDNTDTHPAITPSPTAPSSTLEISPEKHDAKDGSDDGTGHVHELHARPDTATEYQEFMNLHQRFNGSKEWSKVLWKMDVSTGPAWISTLRFMSDFMFNSLIPPRSESCPLLLSPTSWPFSIEATSETPRSPD